MRCGRFASGMRGCGNLRKAVDIEDGQNGFQDVRVRPSSGSVLDGFQALFGRIHSDRYMAERLSNVEAFAFDTVAAGRQPQ